MNGFKEPYMVIGARGMLGTDLIGLLERAGVETVGLDLPDVDIRLSESVKDAVVRWRPGVVINVAALTDVDGCETRPDEAFAVNAAGPANVALAAREHSIPMVHMSTDYVFDGLRGEPYDEDQALSPLGVYGTSKAEGERRVRELLPRSHLIVRTQWLYGRHGKNFVEAILDAAGKRSVLRVVNDQRGSPTYAPDLAGALLRMCRMGALGTVNVTNSGETTWFDFAVSILQRSGLSAVRVEAISTAELGRPAPRPAYSVLDNAKYAQLVGEPLRFWGEALDDYLSRRESGSPQGISL